MRTVNMYLRTTQTIISDTELELDEELATVCALEEPVWYEVHKYINQKELFNKVHQHLAVGHCIGVSVVGELHSVPHIVRRIYA
jgi:hypothetical protein